MERYSFLMACRPKICLALVYGIKEGKKEENVALGHEEDVLLEKGSNTRSLQAD